MYILIFLWLQKKGWLISHALGPSTLLNISLEWNNSTNTINHIPAQEWRIHFFLVSEEYTYITEKLKTSPKKKTQQDNQPSSSMHQQKMHFHDRKSITQLNYKFGSSINYIIVEKLKSIGKQWSVESPQKYFQSKKPIMAEFLHIQKNPKFWHAFFLLIIYKCTQWVLEPKTSPFTPFSQEEEMLFKLHLIGIKY